MRIGILTQWFDPEPGPASIPGVLARGLVARGHEVRVLTGYPNYPQGHLYPGYRMRLRDTVQEAGITTTRVPLYPNHGTSASGRVANYVSFAASASAFGLHTMRRLDALWVYNSPATVALPMWALALGARVPTLLHNMDMWPDSLFATSFLPEHRGGRTVGKALEKWCTGMYASASAVGYISPSAGAELASRGVGSAKLKYLPLWADEEIYYPDEAAGAAQRAAMGIASDEVVVMYAGALGSAQGVDVLARAVNSLPSETKIRCLVVGSGTMEESVRRLALASGGRVSILGSRPPSEMHAIVNAADIQYIGLAPSPMAEYTMPSKLQSIMASGKPLLVSAVGDIRSVAQASGGALLAEAAGVAALSRQIEVAVEMGRGGLRGLGNRSRSYYSKSFSQASGISGVLDVLETISARERSARYSPPTQSRHIATRARAAVGN